MTSTYIAIILYLLGVALSLGPQGKRYWKLSLLWPWYSLVIIIKELQGKGVYGDADEEDYNDHQ